jgi:predicted dehydrogenase
MKLGIIGAGSIVKDHLNAAISVGFEPVAICAKKNSINPIKFEKDYVGLRSYSDCRYLLDIKLDALLIAISGDKLGVFREFESKKIPILIEKPFINSNQTLNQIDIQSFEKVIFGYNRRHYSSIKKLKSIIHQINEGMIEINVPEISWKNNVTKEDADLHLSTNTVHMIDLLNYLIPTRLITSISRPSTSLNLSYINLQFISEKIVGSMNISFGSPDTYQIKLLSNGESIVLSPIEEFKQYVGVSASTAGQSDTFKRYVKIEKSENWKMSKDDLSFKPGFVQQYKDLKELIINPTARSDSAKISDELKVFNFVEGIKKMDLELLNK